MKIFGKSDGSNFDKIWRIKFRQNWRIKFRQDLADQISARFSGSNFDKIGRPNFGKIDRSDFGKIGESNFGKIWRTTFRQDLADQISARLANKNLIIKGNVLTKTDVLAFFNCSAWRVESRPWLDNWRIDWISKVLQENKILLNWQVLFFKPRLSADLWKPINYSKTNRDATWRMKPERSDKKMPITSNSR